MFSFWSLLSNKNGLTLKSIQIRRSLFCVKGCFGRNSLPVQSVQAPSASCTACALCCLHFPPADGLREEGSGVARDGLSC